MPAVQRQGDSNDAGGVATGGIRTVRINNRPVAVPGMAVTPHPCCGRPGCGAHCSATTTGGSRTVRAGGLPILRTAADTDSCGHVRVGGSSNVRTP